MYFDKNIAALTQHPLHEALCSALRQTEAATEISIHQTPDGGITLYYQGAYLHSPAGVLQEAREICEAYCRPGKETTHVLLGLGLGYLLKEVFERSAGTIFIYDPILPVLSFVLEHVDLSPYFESKRVFLSHTHEDLKKQIRASYVFGDHLDILMLEGYAQLFHEDLRDLTTLLSNNLLHAKMNLATIVLQHYKWLEGFFRNLPHLQNTLPFDTLAQRFQGKPALVISRGPSLDQAMDTLKGIQDKVVTIAVGGALRPLLDAGIVPDFAVFADHQGMEHQLRDLAQGTENIHFLLTPFTQRCCFEVPSKEKYLLLSRNHRDYAHWMEKALDEHYLQTRGGGSVSLISFHAAVAMGCNPIVLLGQDLAMQGNHFYAGGTTASLTAEGMVDVPKTENINGSQYRMADIQGQDGSMLKTTSHYLLFANQFMDIAAENAKLDNPLQLINASTGGALLEGFLHQPLHELAETLPASPIKKNFLDGEQHFKQGADRAKGIQTGLQQLISACQQAVQHLEVIRDRLRKMATSPQSQWGNLTPAYAKGREAYEGILKEQPFIAYCLTLDTLNMNRNANSNLPLEEELQQIATYYENCRATLENKILPWAMTAAKQLASQPVVL